MTGPSERREAKGAADDAAVVASQILDRADRDLAFVVRLVGESQHVLLRHFVRFIEGELGRRGVGYGDHPLLRLFIETHARELRDFVLNGVGLRHQFGLKAFETLAGDPLGLLRADLWDSLRSHIEDAERHFLSGVDGLPGILREVEAQSAGSRRPADG